MRIAIVLASLAISATAWADDAAPPDAAPPDAAAPDAAPPDAPPAAAFGDGARPIAGFRVRGDSKVQDRTLGYLTHMALGDPVTTEDLPRITTALISSELFKTVVVSFEDAPGDPNHGVLVVATVDDKHSWIAAPTVFALPGNNAFGVGFAENDFRGLDQKFLLYAQIGTRNSLLFGTFLDPAFRGTKLTMRFDIYLYRRLVDEYANPHDDPRSFDVSRETTTVYLGAGALIGWNFLWWLVGDLRLRGAYVYFRDSHDPNTGDALPRPQHDGRDVSIQAHLTLDHRHHYYGVTWGGYAQLQLEPSIPGLDSFTYQYALLRAYYSWRFFDEHELELRTLHSIGHHMPFHEESTVGGVSDLRGYNLDQFRGDTRSMFRIEYSVPLFKWRFLAFRALGFWDTAVIGFHFQRSDRDYLPEQRGATYWRNDVGAGLRVYLNNIVLPLLGLDFGYGLEGHKPEIYFEVGLTDF